MLRLYSIFTFLAGGLVAVAGRVSGRVLKLKLMLTQPPTESELELGLPLAISKFCASCEKIDHKLTEKWIGGTVCITVQLAARLA